MKTLIFTCKVLAIFITAICCLFSSKMTAQTIQIDRFCISDGEIFLKDKENQIVIPTQRFAEGIYIVKLYCGNNVIESKKITISK